MKREILPLAAFVAIVGALVLGSGCGFAAESMRPYCTSDDQCGPEQVCFPDGCGDPGKDIRVEVTPNVQQGYHAQDFVVEEQLRATLNLDVFAPSAIGGKIERANANISPGVNAYPYSLPVSFSVSGESAVIPGVTRRFSATVTPAQDGTYRMPVASGVFTVALASSETSIPPVLQPNQTVLPGETAEVNFSLASSSDVFRVDGRLVRTGSIPVQSAEMEVQAFDAANLQPLSQRVPASSGTTASTGDFNLFLTNPAEAKYQEFVIVASPKDPAALVPSKKFTVRVESVLRTPLELGDYGVPVEIKGVAQGADGQPIAAATVYVEGPVNGGGDFKSQRVLTDASGAFSLKSLPSRDGSQLTLWVIPPAKNPNGILRKLVAILATNSAQNLGAVTCLPKPILTGSVLTADDQPAAGVRVVAEAIKEAGGGVLPPSGAEAVSDEQGTFRLPLDPASYRLDFIPTEPGQPRASRLMTITSVATENVIDGVKLSRARTVTGRVSGRTDAADRTLVKAVPYAGVRFFRIVTLEGGKKSSVLLAESVADAQGNYQVTLPTR